MQKNTHKKKQILPFFIPMEGCKYRCIYCNQQAISGHLESPLKETIQKDLASWSEDSPCEAAFYGGSFSLLPREKQGYYLDAVAPFMDEGRVSSIRISTHPRGISRANLAFLKEKRVKTIELGIQSFDEHVLLESGRGYGGTYAFGACQAVKKGGFELGIQLMTGLPGDSPAKALLSAVTAIELAPAFVRLYPTVVMPDTPLAKLWAAGQYKPQSEESAVALCADIYSLFRQAGIPVIRMGLNPSENLADQVLDGPYHPAFGYLVMCRLKKAQIEYFRQSDFGSYEALAVPENGLPLVTGDKKSTRKWLMAQSGISRLREDSSLREGSLAFEDQGGRRKICREEDFLAAYTRDIRKNLT